MGEHRVMRKIFGVIGDPIAHSKSPEMHNDLFKHYNVDALMYPFHIKPDQLKDSINGFKAIGISGFNVTIPHKTTIMPFLDDIDPLANAIGAVNTVVNDNGRLIGYNTDGSGFLEGISKELKDLREKTTLIIGAGGAARAIYYSMAHKGIEKIDIANRTYETAETLFKNCPYNVKTDILNYGTAEKQLSKYDLIIQTTSIGMHPNIDHSPISLNGISTGTFVSDIIYTPLETTFLRNAKENGARIQNGLSMFVYQGALAFEKWTGIFPDTERMETNVLKQLGGTTC
jgi:shikimate dehydrogenase